MAGTGTTAKPNGGGKNYSKKERNQMKRAEKLRAKSASKKATAAAAAASSSAAVDPHSAPSTRRSQDTRTDPVRRRASPRGQSSASTPAKRPAPSSSSSSQSKRKASGASRRDAPSQLQRRYRSIRDGILSVNDDDQADILHQLLTDPSLDGARRKLDSKLQKDKTTPIDSYLQAQSPDISSAGGTLTDAAKSTPIPISTARAREEEAQSQSNSSRGSDSTAQRNPRSEATPTIDVPHPSITPHRRGRPVDLSTPTMSTPVNENAFQAPQRKGESMHRFLRRMVKRIVDAIISVGNVEQQRLALRNALGHKDIRAIASSLGFNIESQKVAAHLLSQSKKLITSMGNKNSKRGRGSNESQRVLNAAATLAAPSPTKEGEQDDNEQAKKQPSMAAISRNLGFSNATGHRKIRNGSERRKLIHDGVHFALVSAKSGYQKVANEIREGFVEWALVENQYIKPSPNGNDELLVKDPKGNQLFNEDGTLKRARKYILTIPWRELYVRMLKKASEGGYERAWVDGIVGGKVLIALTMMRYLMPSNIVRMTKRYVSICGCEYCIIMAAMHGSLLIWRFREIKRLEKAVSEMADGAEKEAQKADVQLYKEQIMLEDAATGKWKAKHERAADVLPSITCQKVDGFDYAPWCCYHGECGCDHELDLNPREKDVGGSTIQFWIFVGTKECTYHGLINETSCPECEALDEDGILKLKKKLGRTRPPKVKQEKKRIMMSLPIGEFMEKYYIPQLHIYKRHLAYVQILGKNGCAARRREKGFNLNGCMYCRADYAERFDPSGHNGEIMSEGFGGSGNVSLEGRTARYSNQSGEDRFLFYCNVSDEKHQNAATTKMNVIAMIDDLVKRGEICRSDLQRIMDDTDGCYKQYFSANAYERMSEIATQCSIIFDRAIAAPGHGKNEIDGLNGVVKTILRHYFSCRTQSPMDEDNDTKVAVHKIAAGDNKCIDVGAECHRVLSKAHTDLVELPAAHKKLLQNRKVDENVFLYREEGGINQNMQMTAKGFPKGDGSSKNYNILGDDKLGMSTVAVRMVPCPCNGCDSRLARAWDPTIEDPSKQPRYCGDCTECEMWPVFKGWNNWKIIRLEKKKGKNIDPSLTAEALNESWDTVVVGIGKLLSESVVVGGIGAMIYDGENEAYRPVKWVEEPFELENDTFFDKDESDPPVHAKKGEYACRATYYDPLDKARGWYFETTDKIVVRMRYVLATDVALLDPSDEVKLPNSAKKGAEGKIIKKMDSDMDDYLIDEAKRRECHDFDEYAEDFDVESGDEDEDGEGEGEEDVMSINESDNEGSADEDN